jgi:hypothetical protein
MASFFDLLPIGQTPYPFPVGSSIPDRYSMDLEILQNSRSGGKTYSYKVDFLKGMKSLRYWPAEKSWG